MVKAAGGEFYIEVLTIELLLGPAECFDGSDVELIGMFEVVDEELGHRFGVRLGEVVERNVCGLILFALLHQQYQLVSGENNIIYVGLWMKESEEQKGGEVERVV